MKTCADLDGWLDGTLKAEARPTFEAHLAECERCRQVIARLQSLDAAGRSWRAALPSSPPLTSAAIVARASTPAPRRWWWGVVAAGAVLTLGVWVTRSTTALPLAGTTTRTADESVTLHGEGDVFTVLPRSEVAFPSATRLRLEQGAVRVAAAKRRAGATLVIESGPVIVTVVGTRFEVRRGPAATDVEVEEGVVRVQGPGVDETLSASMTRSVSHQVAVAGVDAGLVEVTPARPTPIAVRPKKATPTQLAAWTRRLVGGETAAVELELAHHTRLVEGDGPALMLLADCRRKALQFRLAAETYETASRVASPADASRALLLAASVRQDELAEPALAAGLLTAYLANARVNDPLRPGAMLRLGRALEATGDRPGAVRVYRRLVSDHAATPEATDSRRRLSTLASPP